MIKLIGYLTKKTYLIRKEDVLAIESFDVEDHPELLEKGYNEGKFFRVITKKIKNVPYTSYDVCTGSTGIAGLVQ